jgi:hypothetical protein
MLQYEGYDLVETNKRHTQACGLAHSRQKQSHFVHEMAIVVLDMIQHLLFVLTVSFLP